MTKQPPPPGRSTPDAAKIILLAALYCVTGKIGLMLAVPPGYATVIWPASGIAVGMLIGHGWRLWPGILLGAFILNCHISTLFSPGGHFAVAQALAAAGIAAGSTLQALTGRMLIARFIGLPLALSRLRQLLSLFLLAGPLACLVASTIGVGALYFTGELPPDKIAENWLTWWTGDTFGVVVFLPLMLTAPGGGSRATWRGETLGRLPLLALLTLLVPLGLTFYGWKIASEAVYQEAISRFDTLTLENEKALLHRIDTYNYALLGGVGFFEGSSYVEHNEWREYVSAIDIHHNFPGISGIGVVQPVTPGALPAFLKTLHKDGMNRYAVHPETTGKPLYLIKYIEPEAPNASALGLNLAFEKNRLAAAALARDSGRAAITRHVTLVQDMEKTPGFLLMHPMYKPHMPVDTPSERRAALTGWIYAPFVARSFLKELTDSQGRDLTLQVHDGDEVSGSTLIYSDKEAAARRPVFMARRKVSIMQADWTLTWESTPSFEALSHSSRPLLILVSGLLFTGLFGVLLIVVTARGTETLEQVAGRKYLALPVVIFLGLSAGVVSLYHTLSLREVEYARIAMLEEAQKIEHLLSYQATDRMQALVRMATRWETAEGTPENQWRSDADSYIGSMPALKTMEWIDPTYHVRWVQPAAGNEKAVGLDVMFDAERKLALQGAAEKDGITLTAPLDLVQGFKGFVAYAPIRTKGVFGGFIAGIFSTNDFFGRLITPDISSDYEISLSYAGKEFFHNSVAAGTAMTSLSVSKPIRVYDKVFTLRLVPSDAILDDIKTRIPFIILVSGLMIAALLSLTVRYILIARIKSGWLERSSKFNQGILASASYIILATDKKGTLIVFNKTAEQSLGYSAAEVIGRHNPSLWHDPDEIKSRTAELSAELGVDIPPGLQTFTRKPMIAGSETREWSYIRKDGTRFPVSLTVTALYDGAGEVTGYLGIAEDVTARREVDRMKSEFISIISHELRTPLTSIRGSLGLIEGTMLGDLPEKARNLVKIAHKNSERLILLVNDILDLDKIAAGKMRFELSRQDTAALVKSGIEVNAAYAEKFKVRFAVGSIPSGLDVHVDPDRWQQVFANLLSNAAKFSPEGGEVAVAVEAAKNRVRVSVTDSGPGIPDEFRARIFTKFSQADSVLTRSKSGTGLGLNISQEIVTRMGGDIGFNSIPRRGATFWFEFPAAHIENGPKKKDDAHAEKS